MNIHIFDIAMKSVFVVVDDGENRRKYLFVWPKIENDGVGAKNRWYFSGKEVSKIDEKRATSIMVKFEVMASSGYELIFDRYSARKFIIQMKGSIYLYDSLTNSNSSIESEQSQF